ncbi:ADP-ribosyl cyclase/cyclic ADP-ribose hydrolase 1-like isoform X3 [Girardinichthys multiradiatus]|uniref:ADP-ribosyl cyclase/cyclic ADP-ribose hydrolase 1-like isoform X3 n=1 Tax=Girardinichthys multiradiatus TaxID=208333 RepID=UPI001FABF8CC|nr:ADP-ribosyl cyclase/cyclic ADP-ribose hydrolase 1-like isoform X3 [Girardinichthys multiradiatus]
MEGPTLMPSVKSACFVIIHITIWIIVPQLCHSPVQATFGTTPNIKHIVIGRCFTYTTLVQPGLRYDCEEIWMQFEKAVVQQSSCNVTEEHYFEMFNMMPQIWPCDSFLFWSKTRMLMHRYAAVFSHFWTLEDTLVGYLFNDLIWCGQEEDSGYFDFNYCPAWSTCRTHPVYSLWKQASQNFAEMACGNITVLLNGSIVNAFNRKSMFGSVELDSLNPQRVNYVNIKVVTNLEGPHIDSCSQGSIIELIQILWTRGFRWTCTESDLTLVILQCIQDLNQPRCQMLANSLLQQKDLTST